MDSSSMFYTRILKDHMPQFTNKAVTLVGKFKGKMGNKLTLETGENAIVVVENCDIKFDVNPSFLEVRGNVKNANTLIMTELSELPEDDKEPFDFDLYNKTVKYTMENFKSLFV